MGYKCRGSFTIKGKGTQALVSDLNNNVIVGKATGKGFDFTVGPKGTTLAGEIVVGEGSDMLVDVTPLLGPTWAERTVVGGSRAGSDGKLSEYHVPETVCLLVYEQEWPLTIAANGEATFFAETKWVPPTNALSVLSQLYPVEITLNYSLEADWWMNGRTLRFQDGKVTQVRYGDFVLVEQGQPIHHWLVECRGSTITLLKGAGIRFHISGGEPQADDEVLVAVRDADIGKIQGTAGVGESLAYTLDEEEFVYSVQTDLEWGAPYPKNGKFIDIVERPIDLLPHEVEILYVKMVDLAQQATRQRREPGVPMPEQDVTEVELARYGRYFGQICTPNQVFHPTAKEIKMLLDTVPADRRKELLEALGQPAWTKRWPKTWEQQGKEE